MNTLGSWNSAGVASEDIESSLSSLVTVTSSESIFRLGAARTRTTSRFSTVSTSQPGLVLLSALACDARSSPVSSSMRRALPNLGGSRTLLPARHAGGPAPTALNGFKKFNQIKKEISVRACEFRSASVHLISCTPCGRRSPLCYSL